MPYNATVRVAAPGSPCVAWRGAIRSRPAAWIWFQMPRNIGATGIPLSTRRFLMMPGIRVPATLVARQNPRSIRERAQGAIDRNPLVDRGCALSAGDCRVVAHLQAAAAHPHQAQSGNCALGFRVNFPNIGWFFADAF